MSDEAKISAVEKYLETEFPGSTVTITRADDGHVLFSVQEAGTAYALTIVPEFLADRGPAEVAAELPIFRVAETMRSMGDFGIFLTNSGCVFA